jgi:hypothetical protein
MFMVQYLNMGLLLFLMSVDVEELEDHLPEDFPLFKG